MNSEKAEEKLITEDQYYKMYNENLIDKETANQDILKTFNTDSKVKGKEKFDENFDLTPNMCMS